MIDLPLEGVRPVLIAKCHPDRPHMAKGLCPPCYQRDYRQRRREADPAYAAREAAYGYAYRRANGRAAQRKYYEQNKDMLRAKGRDWARQRRTDPEYRAKQAIYAQRYWWTLKAEMIAAYGGGCSCCDESESAFLTLEHLNGDGKAHRAKVGNSKVWLDLKKRGWPTDGYTVLCFNCNLGKRVNGGTCPHEAQPASTAPPGNEPPDGDPIPRQH